MITDAGFVPVPTSKLSGWFSQMFTNMQYARMVQVLDRLDDTQLAAIGITRSGIPAHARAVISGL